MQMKCLKLKLELELELDLTKPQINIPAGV
jgi:hypothetical protein